jgi:hypothetical protein
MDFTVYAQCHQDVGNDWRPICNPSFMFSVCNSQTNFNDQPGDYRETASLGPALAD